MSDRVAIVRAWVRRQLVPAGWEQPNAACRWRPASIFRLLTRACCSPPLWPQPQRSRTPPTRLRRWSAQSKPWGLKPPVTAKRLPPVKQLAQANAQELPKILTGMDGANALAANWLRAVVEAIADRELGAGGRLPQAELEAYLADADARHLPQARSLAWDLIIRVDPAAEQRLVGGLLNDPSMELRRLGGCACPGGSPEDVRRRSVGYGGSGRTARCFPRLAIWIRSTRRPRSFAIWARPSMSPPTSALSRVGN